jgi:predicted dehydrogenase
MNDKVVFGLIGAGGISQSQHLPNLSRSRNIHLKTVCDLHPELLEQARQAYGIKHTTQNFREVLSDPEIQALVIATRVDAHVPLAMESLRAGKHVYVEKPLAETAEECKQLLSAVSHSGRILAVGHNRRMAPAYQMLRKILKAHGGAKNLYYRIADNLYVWGKAAGVTPGTRVLHEVCHIFDLLRYLVESEVTSVYCASSRPDDEMIVLTFENGTIASILSSGFMTPDMPKEHLEVVMDVGGAIVEDCVELQTYGLKDFERTYRFAGRIHPQKDVSHRYMFEKQGVRALLDYRRIFWEKQSRLEHLEKTAAQSPERFELEEYINQHAPNPNYTVNKGWQDSVEHLADCILDGRPCNLSTVDDGMKVMLLGHAAIQSRERNQVVHAPFGDSPKVEVTVNEAIAATHAKPARVVPLQKA